MASNTKQPQDSPVEPSSLKAFFLGDGNVGKSSLIGTLATGEFPRELVPTVFGWSAATAVVDGIAEELVMHDAQGSEYNERLQRLGYPGTDVFIVHYSVDNHHSFNHVLKHWYLEVQRFMPGTPIALVGTKADLREDKAVIAALAKDGRTCISDEEGVALGRRINATVSMSVSALRGVRVKELFDEVVRAARAGRIAAQERAAKKKFCVVA